MEIRQLRYFVEICHSKSFSQAASMCYISPQGMSMSMMRLEEELGRKLFIRSHMGIALTPHAEFLLPKAKKILAIAEECEAYFSSDRQEESIIPLYCSHGTIEEYAGKVLQDFQAAYPEIKIQVKECSDMDADEAVLSEECEMALTVGPLPKERFNDIHIMSSDYVLIAKEDDPIVSRSALGIEDLKDLPLVVMKGGLRTYPYLHSVCSKHGFEPKIHTFADNILLVFYMATLPGVYGITTQSLFNRLNAPGIAAVKIDSPDFVWKVHAIKKKGAALSVPIELLWKYLLAHTAHTK